MTVTVLVPDDDGLAALSELPGVHAVRYKWGQPLPREAVKAEVLIPGAHRATDELFDQLPNLRLIQLLSAGAEDWIGTVPDGVLLSTCRGAHGGSTAEWVIAALLSLYRELPSYTADQAVGRWQRRTSDTLQGKRILIVGAGDLGQQLRRRIEPFETKVTMVGLSARDGVHAVSELRGLLGTHDVVVLMVPLTSRTRGMADAGFFAAMQNGAVLVNAARGAVVNTGALVEELKLERIRAVLDVTDPEPLPVDHPLWKSPGATIYPHIGGAVHGTRKRSYAVVAAEIARYAGGELPHNLVHGEY